jgi:hypothetical protein
MLMYLYLLFVFGCRTRGNSGGHFSLASLMLFASLFVIPRDSRSESVIALILHPTVLNSSAALLVSLNLGDNYLAGLI